MIGDEGTDDFPDVTDPNEPDIPDACDPKTAGASSRRSEQTIGLLAQLKELYKWHSDYQ